MIKSNIATNNTEGILDVDAFVGLQLSPNPTTGLFQVMMPESIVADYVVYDMNGKMVLRQEKVSDPVTTLDISQYPAGTYLLRVTAADGRIAMRRIVKK